MQREEEEKEEEEEEEEKEEEDSIIPANFFVDINYVLDRYEFRSHLVAARDACAPRRDCKEDELFLWQRPSCELRLEPCGTELNQDTFVVEAYSLKAAKTDFDLTGQILWPGTEILCAFLVSPYGQSLIRGRSCVELGSGAGVVGLLAAQFACRVIFTDHNEIVLDLLRKNIGHTQAASAATSPMTSFGPSVSNCQMSAEKLDWGSSISASWLDNVEVILGSDIVYSASSVIALLTTVTSIFNAPSFRHPEASSLLSSSSIFILSYVSRWSVVDAALHDGFLTFGLRVRFVPLSDFMEVSDRVEHGSLMLISASSSL